MRYLKRVALLVVAVAAMLAPSTAMGATAPGYEEFDGCPSRTVDPNITLCTATDVIGGHIKLGSKDTPIVDPIEMSLSVAPPDIVTVGTFDGGSQPVPGGLVGITGLNWLIYLFPNNVLGLYAETELAGTPSNPIQEPVSLPIKVHLNNVLLSSSCYVGSNSNPIALQLITSTTNPPPPNTPITGNTGSFTVDPVLPNVFRVSGMTLVDNSFAAPAAAGCTLLLPGLGLIDPIVNLQAGLPSAAGNNTAVQDLEVGLADITAVYPPNGFE
jgi:hypothetical protein